MKTFGQIEATAGKFHGGAKGIRAALQQWQVDTNVEAKTDDRFLSGMARAVFSSGFSWKVIEIKWPGFEVAFDGFAPKRVAAYSDEKIDALLKDTRIVRNGAKIMATIENARFVVAIAKQHGSFGRFLSNWPVTDQVGLLDFLKKNASRLGGATAQYFLRFEGWDAFILSGDVVAALIREGVVTKPPTTKKELAAVQAAFNTWRDQSGRPVREISRILAMSVGPRGPA
ncbi:MAG: DNA-3-methyladenine glycosylase I [Hyphomonadaceae bacterium]